MSNGSTIPSDTLTTPGCKRAMHWRHGIMPKVIALSVLAITLSTAPSRADCRVPVTLSDLKSLLVPVPNDLVSGFGLDDENHRACYRLKI
jgi:hypothetical protein